MSLLFALFFLIFCALIGWALAAIVPGVYLLAAGVALVAGFVGGFLANCLIAASERVTARRDRLKVDGNNNDVRIIIDGEEVYRRG